MLKFGLAAVCAAGFLAGAGQAAADTIWIAVKGTVDSGHDEYNTFGLGNGADLAGQSFEVYFGMNTGHYVDNGSGSSFSQNFSGPLVNLVINKYTYSFGTYSQFAFQSVPPNYIPGQFTYEADNLVSFIPEKYSTIYIHGIADTVDPDWRAIRTEQIVSASGEFNINGIESGGYPYGPAVITNRVSGRFTATSVTVGGPPSVPEPASWALMIMGFGGVGGVFRLRRRPGVDLCAE